VRRARFQHRTDRPPPSNPTGLRPRTEDVHPIELLDRGAEAGTDSRQLLSRTWQLSLDALSAQGLPEATALLRLLACWAGDPLPLTLLSGADLGAELHPSRVEPALRGLLDHSLTELVPGRVRCLRVHGILLDSVARATPDDQCDRLAATATRLLRAVLPEVPQRGVQDPAVTLLAPHVTAHLRRAVGRSAAPDVLEGAADCVLRLVVAVHRSGDYASALTLANEALALVTRGLAVDNVFALRLRLRRSGRAAGRRRPRRRCGSR
ncbi:tetratricopeptide repeat protein, partial [Streptomyces massasporeus]